LVHEHEPFPDYVLPGGNPVVASLEPRVRERVEACAVAVLEFKHSGDPLWVRRAKRIGNYVRALDSAWVSGNVTALLDLLESPPSSVRRALNLKPRPV
jgi:hypothetical protein